MTIPVAVVVLAAGKGKRMVSDLPKVLQPLAGRPLVTHVLGAVSDLKLHATVVVVGYQGDKVRAALAGLPLVFAEQTEQLGTGHAVMQARPFLGEFTGTVLVLVGDAPLLRAGTLSDMLHLHERERAACTILSTRLEDPKGYGRIVRDGSFQVTGIVEDRDASPEQLQIKEINSGILAFQSEALWEHIAKLKRANTQEEYYLTDLVGLLRVSGLKVTAWCTGDPREVLGVNSSEQLALLERIYHETHRAEKGIDRP